MDRLYASSLAVDLTKRAIDSNTLTITANANGAKFFADFIVALAKHLEESDLPNEAAEIK